MEVQGLSQNQLAKRSGVTQATISRFLAGRSTSYDRVERLTRTLGIECAAKKKRK